MPSTVFNLAKKQLISPPGHVTEGTQYEVITGSVAYGCSSDTSDMDIVGWCIPNLDMIFPHLRGEIDGFGPKGQRFEQFEQHGVKDGNKVYDLNIYNVVKYFDLIMSNNPNMLDTLFAPQRCILSMTPVAQVVRENRKMFLHKGAWHKYKGYAFSQLNKIKNKTPGMDSKRSELVKTFGYDVKYASSLVRLLLNVEQILIEGDLDIEREREVLKSIRRGEWTLSDIQDFFDRKERDLESVYINSKLPHSPDVDKVKTLLLNVLEQHFGSLDKVIVREDKTLQALRQIDEICLKLRMGGVL